MYRSIIMAEFEQLLKNKAPNVIDVREEYEFEDGHIKDAELSPMGTIPENLNKLDKAKEYHLICYSGARSARAAKYLADQGFQIVNVMGGMSAYRGEMEFGK